MAVSGLAALKAQQAENARKEAERNRPKVNWFGSWAGGDKKKPTTAVFRFLQEIDENSPEYRTDRGKAILEVEHQAPGPDGFKKRASCSAGDADGLSGCYACDQHSTGYREIEDYKGEWKQRQNFYIYALVDFEDGSEPQVYLISRNFNSTFVSALIEEAGPEDEGGEGAITNANYKVTKTGAGTQTQWLLKRLKTPVLDDSEVGELPAIEEVALRKIPYAEQERWYATGSTKPAAKSDRTDDSEEVTPVTEW